MVGTEAGVEAESMADDKDGGCDDNNVGGGEAADEVFFEVVWTASEPER